MTCRESETLQLQTKLSYVGLRQKFFWQFNHRASTPICLQSYTEEQSRTRLKKNRRWHRHVGAQILHTHSSHGKTYFSVSLSVVRRYILLLMLLTTTRVPLRSVLLSVHMLQKPHSFMFNFNKRIEMLLWQEKSTKSLFLIWVSLNKSEKYVTLILVNLPLCGAWRLFCFTHTCYLQPLFS